MPPGMGMGGKVEMQMCARSAPSDLQRLAFTRRLGGRADSLRVGPDPDECLIRSAGLVMEEPQAAGIDAPGELRALPPAAVAPPAMLRQLIRREMRIED